MKSNYYYFKSTQSKFIVVLISNGKIQDKKLDDTFQKILHSIELFSLLKDVRERGIASDRILKIFDPYVSRVVIELELIIPRFLVLWGSNEPR